MHKYANTYHNFTDVFLICILTEAVKSENKRCSEKLEKIKISHGLASNSDF